MTLIITLFSPLFANLNTLSVFLQLSSRDNLFSISFAVIISLKSNCEHDVMVFLPSEKHEQKSTLQDCLIYFQ